MTTIKQGKLVDINRALHSTKTEYTFCSTTHGTLTKTEDVLGHKTNNLRLKEMKSYNSIDHNRIKLRISNRKIPINFLNISKLNNTFPDNQWITKDLKGNFFRNIELNEDEKTTSKSVGFNQGGSWKKFNNTRCILRKRCVIRGKKGLNNASYCLKKIEKKQNKPKTS